MSDPVFPDPHNIAQLPNNRIIRKLQADIPNLPFLHNTARHMTLLEFARTTVILSDIVLSLWDDYKNTKNDSTDADADELRTVALHGSRFLAGIDKLYHIAQQLKVREKGTPGNPLTAEQEHTIVESVGKATTLQQAYKAKLPKAPRPQAYPDAPALRYAKLVSCLNPMAMEKKDVLLSKYPHNKSSWSFTETSRFRRDATTKTLFLRPDEIGTDESAGAKRGGFTGNPIHPDTGLQYYQTMACYADITPDRALGETESNKELSFSKKCDCDPWYKYKAMVWGRRLYASIILDEYPGWEEDPIYGLPWEHFQSIGHDPSGTYGDYAYLELAELELRGLLIGMGLKDIKENQRIHNPVVLPYYQLKEASIYNDIPTVKQAFEKGELAFAIGDVHRHHRLDYADWREPRNNGTSRFMLAQQICKEKTRLGLIDAFDVDDREKIKLSLQNHPCINERLLHQRQIGDYGRIEAKLAKGLDKLFQE